MNMTSNLDETSELVVEGVLSDIITKLYKIYNLICLELHQISMIEVLVLITTVVCVFMAIFMLLSNFRFLGAIKHIPDAHRVLFVTAHPDDECMFFGPTIQHFTTQGDPRNVFLLCLSPGRYKEDNYRRKEELWASCLNLGILSENITLIRAASLPDDPNEQWPPGIISDIVANHVHRLGVNIVLTFDGYGVSGHVNHIRTAIGVYSALVKNKLPSNCLMYCLESTNIFRKYLGPLDVFISYVCARYIYICTSKQRSTIHNSLRKHESQYVWFRKLYIRFSKYSYVNQWQMPLIRYQRNDDKDRDW